MAMLAVTKGISVTLSDLAHSTAQVCTVCVSPSQGMGPKCSQSPAEGHPGAGHDGGHRTGELSSLG